MRKSRNILVLLTVLMSVISMSAQSVLSIHRNDGKFNQVNLSEGTEIHHDNESDIPKMVITDWVSGEETIPLSSIDRLQLKHTDIPTFRFTFPDYPEVDNLWDKELYLQAELDIEGHGMVEDMIGLTLQVKGRGNSTWNMAKKPMRMKFSKKTSICGFKKSKNYVLLANYMDPSLMRNSIAMWLARRLEVPYYNTMIPCNVVINGHYAGSYVITEKVGINSSSVDINEEEGILFELSKEYDELYKFRSSVGSLPVMVKDPDFDELYEDNPEGPTPMERLTTWRDDFNRAEALVAEGKGLEAFDLESAVRYMLLYQIVGNGEIGHPKSLYIHKKSLEPGEKYHLGPAWDFDVAFNINLKDDGVFKPSPPNGGLWMIPMLGNLCELPEFKEKIKSLAVEYIETIYPELMEFIDSYAEMIESSGKLNGQRWPETVTSSWTEFESSYNRTKHVSELKEWLEARCDYIRERFITEKSDETE